MESYYTVDRDLQIIDAGGDWDDFALQNDGAECLANQVKNTALLSHVQGDTPRMWVDTVVRAAFSQDRKIIKPYRCDSDRIKRHMVMEVLKDGRHTAMIRHKVIREEKMPATQHIVFFPSSKQRKPRCSVCNKIKVDGEWIDPAEFTEWQMHHVIYDVCEPCGDTVFKVSEL